MGATLNYYLLTSKSSISEIEKYPAIVIRRNNWDDFGYKTTIELTYYESSGVDAREIGHTKILKKNDGDGYTTLPSDCFNSLTDDYCTLGQTPEFYRNVKENNLDNILDDLRDCALSDAIRDMFEKEEAFKVSLLRSSQAEKMLSEAKVIFSGQVTKSQNLDFSFKYNLYLSSSKKSTSFSFDFLPQEVLPFRINVIVGRNASGKSQVLSNLAVKLSGMGSHNNRSEINRQNDASIFGDIHVLSYSPFDTFRNTSELNDGKVSKNNISSGLLPYNFLGLRRLVPVKGNKNSIEILLKSHGETRRELNKNYKSIVNKNRLNILDELFEICLGFNVSAAGPKEVIRNYESFSSGQKILIKMVTDLLSSLEKEDLILIDEPESYLHPQGISKFYHCVNKVLELTESFCVMATHSPIIVQETPSKYIHILRMQGNAIVVEKPKVETLGQGISSIIDEVFKVEFDDLNFFNTFKTFAEKNVSLIELENILGNKLDFSAKTYYLSLVGRKNEK